MKKMELCVLGYFLAVARKQSIVRGAESLHLSQPTLSIQIKAMEKNLVKQLLIQGTKDSRKVTLTEESMILRKRAEEIFNLVQKMEREISYTIFTSFFKRKQIRLYFPQLQLSLFFFF